MVLIAAAATALTVVAALLAYLAAPRQVVLPAPLPRRMALIVAAGLGLAGLVLFRQVAGPAAAVFILATVLMLAWSVVPVPAALWGGRRNRADG